MNREIIRDWLGKPIGSIETDSSGDQCLKDFYGRILGRYKKRFNATFDFYGRKIGNGNQLMRLLK